MGRWIIGDVNGILKDRNCDLKKKKSRDECEFEINRN